MTAVARWLWFFFWQTKNPRDQIISRPEKWHTISLKLARPEKINSSDHSRATNTVFFWCRKTSRDQFISRAEKWSSRFEESLKSKIKRCHPSIASQCFFRRRKSSRDQIVLETWSKLIWWEMNSSLEIFCPKNWRLQWRSEKVCYRWQETWIWWSKKSWTSN